MADEKTRYSESELNEFREIINGKIEQATAELKELQEQITHKGEFGSGDTNYKFKGLEDGAGSSEREYLAQMASRQNKFIDHLDKALIRIENGTYGICRVTGKLIAPERLRAVPHATLSIEAKKAQS